MWAAMYAPPASLSALATIELGLELQVLVGCLVIILMTFHVDHGWWIGNGAEGRL
jgi:hypothetical protein